MRPFCTDVGFCSGSLADAGLLCARLDSKPQSSLPQKNRCQLQSARVQPKASYYASHCSATQPLVVNLGHRNPQASRGLFEKAPEADLSGSVRVRSSRLRQKPTALFSRLEPK